jgi:hypothetical protein
MTAPRKAGGQLGNRNARTHGVRANKTATRRRVYGRAEFKRELLTTWPHLNAVELEVGIAIRVNLRALRTFIDAHGVVSTQGRVLKAATEWDRQLGRWESWVRRATDNEATQSRSGLREAVEAATR